MEFYWKCQYNDGTEISSKESRYQDIDRAKLEKFILLQVENDKPVLVLNLDGSKKLIVRMRTAMKMSGAKESVWIVGYQENLGAFLGAGRTTQMICFVFEDGTIEVTDGFKADHKWFYPISFLPEEM